MATIPATTVDLFALAEIFIGVTIIAGAWLAILSWFYETKRMMRWRSEAFIITVGFTASMFFNSLGMITVVNNMPELTAWLFNLTVLSLLVSFAAIGIIARDIASLERLGVGLQRLERVSFPMQPERAETTEVGIAAVDALLNEKPQRAPFALFGPDGTHQWRLAQQFIVSGLVKGEPCIYFAITRPPELIIEQLNSALEKQGKKLELFKDNFVIIDCFTPFAGLSEHETFFMEADYKKAGWLYVAADPRDLNDMHTAYREARRLLNYKPNIRVLYDTFTGVTELADSQLLYQYLLHTTTAEDKFHTMSLYLLKKEGDVELIRPMVSGLITLELKNGERAIEIVKMTTKYKTGRFKLDDGDNVVAKTSKKAASS